MVTKSLNTDYDVLLNSIRKLGNNSKESYVIFDATKHHCILECNDSFCMLTNAARSQVLNTDYFSWLSMDEKKTTIEMIKEKIHNGIMVQAKLYHNGINKPPFWAEIQALPFCNDANITQFVLVFVKDVTYYHTEDFLMRLENDMYRAIEKEFTFEQKMKIICHGLDEFFMPNIASMVLIKTEVNQLQVFIGDNQTESVPRCCANNDFFNKVMQSETSTFIENLDEVNIPEEHKQYASLAKKPHGWFIPIRNQQRQVIGVFSIFSQKTQSDQMFKNMFRKIGALVALAYSYARTQKKFGI